MALSSKTDLQAIKLKELELHYLLGALSKSVTVDNSKYQAHLEIYHFIDSRVINFICPLSSIRQRVPRYLM